MILLRRLIILVSMVVTTVSLAQDNISIPIEVRYEGVEIRRENTDLWLDLPQGALAFIGAGDTIRTDEEGRVNVLLDELSNLLLLSNSDFTLNAMTIADDQLSVDGMINGTAVIETTSDAIYDSFNLHLNDVTITQPATLMGVWSFSDVVDSITVANGTAIVIANDEDITIPIGSGYFAEPDRTEATPFDPEWHAAGLEASLYGCPGQVKTTNGVPLLVRTGPGTGFARMGALDVSRIIPLMGVTETTGWTRIQFLTGFGWIQSLAVESNCTDLPIFPDDSPEEKFVTIVNVTDTELAILQPFLQSSADNLFVYRFVANP